MFNSNCSSLHNRVKVVDGDDKQELRLSRVPHKPLGHGVEVGLQEQGHRSDAYLHHCEQENNLVISI